MSYTLCLCGHRCEGRTLDEAWQEFDRHVIDAHGRHGRGRSTMDTPRVRERQNPPKKEKR